jgi:hypothetical protein
MAGAVKATSHSESWDIQTKYVVYDPAYTKSASSAICTVCKVIRFFDTVHEELYPHAENCTYKGTGFFSGYVIGPNVNTNAGSKFREVMSLAKQENSTKTFGPFQNHQLFNISC